MMRSLFAGVSGLQNHQTRMDVIGNNISNVNTTGFKKGRVSFQDLLSQNIKGASRPNERIGGVNPQQVGLGVNVASIDTIHTQGALQTTGVKSDLAIEGDGFFVLRAGDEDFYTRDGTFGLDRDGMFVNPANGMRVQGWLAEQLDGTTIINSSAAIEDLHIPIGSKDPAQETTEVFLASNLDRNTPIVPPGATTAETLNGTWTVEYDIYDSFGASHNLNIEFTRIAGIPNQWEATTTINPAAELPTTQTVSVGDVASLDDSTFIVSFDNNGTLLSVSNAEGGLLDTGALAVQIAFEVTDANPEIDPATGLAAPALQTFNLNLGEVGSFINSMTQFNAASSTKIFEQNGYGMGYLDDYRVDQNGLVTGIFSNGNVRTLGQVALSTFTNPGGLEKEGENNYRSTTNSGIANVGVVGTAGRGKIIAGTLEMSNVDLAEQFTDMIVTQRGFQANSRTIQTSDQMLQEILTLKR